MDRPDDTRPPVAAEPDWLATPVRDELVLRTVPGAVDYLADSLTQLGGGVQATIVGRLRDGVRVAYHGPLRALAADRYFSSCAVVLAETTTEPGVDLITPPAPGGVLAALAADGEVTFRVGDLGRHRFAIRDTVRDTLAWRNDPRDWAVNLVWDGSLVLAEIGALHTTRRFGRLERLPASTTPVISAVLTRLLKAEPQHVVLDPFCGSGTNLLHVYAMSGVAVILGTDRDRGALRAAAENLRRARAPRHLAMADATALPFADGSVDRIVANLPFGKRVGSHQRNEELYPAFLRELARVMATKARAVLLTEDKRLLRTWVRRVSGLRPVKEVGLESGGAHPSAFVLTNRPSTGRRAR
ncbi:MAG: methyltransferase domain-containing protein [Micromonosporaceae bacterium]